MTTRKRAWNNSAFANSTKSGSSVETIVVEDDADTDPNNELGGETLIIGSNEKPQKSKIQLKSLKSSTNWIDIFEPCTSDDVAVHPKKFAELQSWLLHCEAVHKQHPAQFCLLTGPTGAGKTAAARVLARSMKYEWQEWVNPVDREFITTLGDQTGSNIASQIDLFKSFLFRSSRYKSLFGREKRLVVVEDFPNTIISNADTFESILEEYSKYGKAPLLFIVTDSKTRSLNVSYNLFSEQIKHKYHINHISFNPIAVTLLQKAMKRFCTLMKEPHLADTYSIPSQAIIDSVIIAAQGDIRNAIINLHFASIKGAGTLPIERLESSEVKGKSKKKLSTLKTIRRDESVTMMHALGRVFNPKFLSSGNFTHKPEDISDSFTSEPKRFIDLIHANYMPHFNNIEHIVEAADALSIADNIITEYREDALAIAALNLAVRSIMVANQNPVSAWLPVRAPKRNQQDILLNSRKMSDISSNLYATDYGSYVHIIHGAKKI